MSGFEVAGVVLGDMPLVIEALKFYQGGIGTIHDMFKYSDTFDIICVEFSTNLRRFMQESENLCCKELEMLDHQYKEFMKDGGKGWDQDSRTDLERDFRSNLGDDWETYIQLSGYLRKRLNLLKKKLDLNEDFSVPFVVDDGNSKVVDKLKCADFFTISRQIKGALSKGHLKTLVSEIGNDVEKLGRLTRYAIELEPIRHQQAKQSPSTGVSRYWLSV